MEEKYKVFERKFIEFNIESEKSFKDLIKDFILTFDLDEDSCSKVFDISYSTVRRWKEGSTVPPYLMRLVICSNIRKYFDKKFSNFVDDEGNVDFKIS